MKQNARLILKDINASSGWVICNKVHDLLFAGEIGHELPFEKAKHLLEQNKLDISQFSKKRMYVYPHYTIVAKKNRGKKIVFIFFCISLLSLYPIYKNFYNGRAITTYERHIALVQGRSEYYNPWQYRMLCPFIIESMKWVYDRTLDKVLPIEKILQNRTDENSQTTPEGKEFIHMFSNPEVIKYMIVFIFFQVLFEFFSFYFGILSVEVFCDK